MYFIIKALAYSGTQTSLNFYLNMFTKNDLLRTKNISQLL